MEHNENRGVIDAPFTLYGLDIPFLQVREFHKAFDHPAPDHPHQQSAERAAVRAQWIKEECDELIEAKDYVEQADAYIDIIYFALGGLVEMGILPQALMSIVHNANMGKLHYDPETGELIHKKDPITGKTLKPDNWARDHDPEQHLTTEIASQLTRIPLAKLGA
jgi:predicted HAD superfamily Cof-like phosphohydrolase